MISFSRNSIYQRIIERIRRAYNFGVVSDDSDLAFLIRALADNQAELVRYGEYLLRESKWETARNLSSVLAMVRFLGYKPPRRKSAIGVAYISHDPLLKQVETYNSVLGRRVVLDDLSVFQGAGYPEVVIPRGTKIFSVSGVPYVTAEDAVLSGVSGNQRYVAVSIVQGEIVRVEVQLKGNTPFEEIVIPDPNVENADPLNPLTRQFFKVVVRSSYFDPLLNRTLYTSEEWKEIDNIRAASYYEKVFEVVTDYQNAQNLIIRFGNGVMGSMPLPGSIVEVHYLRTAGIRGNLYEKHELESIEPIPLFAGPQSQNQEYLNLYVTNLSPILGGEEFLTIEDIKARASQYALINTTIGTKESYEAAIKSIPGIAKARVYAKTKVYPNGASQDFVVFTCIDTFGERPEKNDILRKVKDLISNRKSPTDVLDYEPANFLHLAINTKVFTKDPRHNLTHVRNKVSEALYNRFQILNLDFEKPILSREISETIMTIPEVYNYRFYCEAVIILNNPQGSLLGSGVFIPFEFDQSYTSSFGAFKDFTHGMYHTLKVVVKTSNPDLDRVFLLTREELPQGGVSTLVRSFQYFSRVTDLEFMSILLRAYPYKGRFNSEYNNQDAINLLGGIAPAENTQLNAPLKERAFDGFSIQFDAKTGSGSLYIPSDYHTLLGNQPSSASLSNIRILIFAEPFTQDFYPKKSVDCYKIYPETIVTETYYVGS